MSESFREGPLKQFNGWTVLPPDIIETPHAVVSDVDSEEDTIE